MEFSDLTTLHVGGPAPTVVTAHTQEELVDAVSQADSSGTPLLVLGGGSNLLVSDTGFEGVVVRDGRAEISEVDSYVSCGGSTVKATGGTTWDDFVRFTLDNDLAGFEMLSGIPGTLGGAVAHNIGAYGQEISQTLSSIRALDRLTGRVCTLTRLDLHFSYRESIISRSRHSTVAGGGRTWGPTGRWVVLEAAFQLRSADISEPIRYESLAHSLGVNLGTRVNARRVRDHIFDRRRHQDLLPDPSNPATWSAGSFFRNPILTEAEAARLPDDTPRFPVRNEARFVAATVNKQAPLVEGKVKIPAAWVLEQAGFPPGFRLRPNAGAVLSPHYVLALTNLGEANAAEIAELAEVVREGVRERFGITLAIQPVSVAL